MLFLKELKGEQKFYKRFCQHFKHMTVLFSDPMVHNYLGSMQEVTWLFADPYF